MSSADPMFRAPPVLDDLTELPWNLRDIPDASGGRITFDLNAWREPSATGIIGVVCAIARFTSAGPAVAVAWPEDKNARRLLGRVGVTEALQTVTQVGGEELGGTVQDHYPIIPVTNFRTPSDVDKLGERLEEDFTTTGPFAANLLGDVYTCLTEGANNVVEHACSPVGGFAMVQGRHFEAFGRRHHYIEIAVGDPGIGIAKSLGLLSDQEAIVKAMEEGVTSTAEPTRGAGLYWIEDAASKGLARVVMVHSGQGSVLRGSGVEAIARDVPCTFGGTLLTVILPYT